MRIVMAMRAVCVLCPAGCDDGPGERTGKKIDEAWDRLTGKGPAEKAGERIDKAVDALEKN